MERTTKLEQLKKGSPYTWGAIIKIHEIGPYAVVEAYSWKTDGCTVLSGNADKDKISFHTYVHGNCCGHAYNSLDAALAGCIAYRNEGCNHRADYYFIKSIGGYDEKEGK